ncbi:MAG: hypothetical protein ACRDPW_00775 [Mycobacteriales bacterium]
MILDAGALIGYERGNLQVAALLEWAARNAIDVKTTTGVIAQVWRSGARQAKLALLLRNVAEVELSSEQARRVGTLLSTAACSDVIDASIVDISRDGDEVLTSDPDDIAELTRSAGKHLLIRSVT